MHARIRAHGVNDECMVRFLTGVSSYAFAYAAAPRLGPVERWFLPALLLTLVLHAAGYHLLHVTRFSGFTPLPDIRQTPRAFQIKQATIDPKTLDDRKDPAAEKVPTKPVPDVTEIQIPGDAKPSYEKMMQQAETVIAAPESVKTMVQDKPKVDASKTLDKVLADDNPQQLPSDIKSMTDQLLNGKPNVTGSHPSFDVIGAATTSRPNVGPNVGMPNFSATSTACFRPKGRSPPRPRRSCCPRIFSLPTIPRRSARKPSAACKNWLNSSSATRTRISSSRATRIQFRHAGVQRGVEPRAGRIGQGVAVGIRRDRPARIQTRGFGMTRLLVKSGTVDEQRLNRRVEIVIHNNRGTAR